MASKASQVEHLKSVPLFAGLNKKQLQLIAKSADEITVASGTVLVDQGQTGREAFLVLEGTVGIKRNGRKVATLGPGAIVGELALLDHGPRTATAVCESDATLLVVDRRNFLSIVESSHTLTSRLLEYLASRIRELDKTVYG
ncbi:MAG TPA: cyclic nucleotide-binding domain-containing protein [Ilumatobacter sp.]|nr:cyclic nucleotide-binding domain-containing protein [Ilumatobacter sp.]